MTKRREIERGKERGKEGERRIRLSLYKKRRDSRFGKNERKKCERKNGLNLYGNWKRERGIRETGS